MRSAAPPLLPLFRSRLQGDLLALFFADPDREWSLHELSDRTRSPYQTVVNEVRRLCEAELLNHRQIGRNKMFNANESSPHFTPLTQVVLMSFGPPVVIEEEFAGIEGIDQLFIYGSWAARHHGIPGGAPQDGDVLVVGTASRDDLYEAAVRAEQRLGREVNLTLRSPSQWASPDDGFSRQVKESPIIQIV